ncbi:hypothetical protein HBN50_01360 [Halobacteriovorax sp. GB3]|uniref:hypothetical protein n=1 Tax=Halobacteriovorax sp. GB3 TaxID=2719615 RepID=UPI00235F77D5|nr:hypothetical protein [Halobacteriovorax sp. GB3]MDD0851716.1 hypothetical protein [Halobacteriovorax sp. GB3]
MYKKLHFISYLALLFFSINAFSFEEKSIRDVYQYELTKGESYQCFWLSEVEKTLVCSFADMYLMNDIFLGASLFVENKDQQLLDFGKQEDFEQFLHYRDIIGGHDLRGEDLLLYRKTLIKSCRKNIDVCVNDSENAFFKKYLDKIILDPDTVVISYVAKSRDTLEHEFHHALYFQNDHYRLVVQEFWENELDENTREAIRQRLQGIYDRNNEDLMMNEFQAYILYNSDKVNYFFNINFIEIREMFLERLRVEGLEKLLFRN